MAFASQQERAVFFTLLLLSAHVGPGGCARIHHRAAREWRGRGAKAGVSESACGSKNTTKPLFETRCPDGLEEFFEAEETEEDDEASEKKFCKLKDPFQPQKADSM